MLSIKLSNDFEHGNLSRNLHGSENSIPKVKKGQKNRFFLSERPGEIFLIAT